MEMKAIEIGLILVVILVIFGVILSSIENTTEKVIKEAEANNMEKFTSEVIDNLINNPGIPNNWNEYGKGTPGLAIVNDGGQTIPNSVSYAKLVALGNDYRKLVHERLFSSKIHTSMELQPQQSSISNIKIGEEGNGESTFSITRLVKCDFYKSYVIKDFEIPGKCNRKHSQNEYSCYYFKAFEGNLKKSDYYILIDNTEEYDLSYIVDTTRVVKQKNWKTAISDSIRINDEIEFYDDSSAVVFVHIDKAHPKAMLVCVPKNFDKSYLDYDYFKTNECKFILTAWY